MRKGTDIADSAANPGVSLEGQGRSRTFTGCRTCRGRHLKCDEARPTCSTCSRLSLVCEGYEARLLWVPELQNGPSSTSKSTHQTAETGPGPHRAASYRYPLFTESARCHMSKELVASLGSRSVTSALQCVDASEQPGPSCHLEGPFGVFDPTSSTTGARTASPSGLPLQTTGECSLEQQSDAEEADEEVVPTVQWSPREFQLSPGMLQMLSGTDAHFSHEDFSARLDEPWDENAGAAVLDTGLFDDFMAPELLFYSSPRSPRTPRIGSRLASPGASSRAIRASALPRASRSASRVPSRLASPAPSCQAIPRNLDAALGPMKNGMSMALPSSAAHLLRFYKENVLEALTPPLKARTSPWKLLILPRALETFAELSLWNTASHTRCSIFFCLLAQSALHLAQSPDLDGSSVSKWTETAETHQIQAREHLKRALEHEMDGENQAEYTELLMGLLATALVSVPFHGSVNATAILTDAEHLIRLRGFPIRKTFHARMLHHMYTHARILIESTRHSGPSSSQTRSNSPATTIGAPRSERQAISGPVSLRNFSLAEDSIGSDLDLNMEKPPDIGYSDIHLDISGTWHATLYPDIYGIPESLMTLLSQTVSLANSKPKLDAIATTDPALSAALSQHIKTLEKNIWSWTIESTTNLPVGPGRPDNLICHGTKLWEHPQTRRVILAMHQGLIIYFYRRIYNMSAMLIQDAVRRALDHLEGCLDLFMQDQDLASSVAWCSFIAACEAVAPELQEQALRCLQKTDEVGVILTTRKPSEVAAAVWQRREQTGDWTLSWPDLPLEGVAS